MIDWTWWNRVLYSGWAPFYDVLVLGLEEKRRKSLEAAGVQPGEKVLLLGAGTGLDLKYLPAGVAVTAIDITPGMIARLNKRAERLGLEVDSLVMDGQNLEFKDESFDVVILHFVLAVIPNPYQAIQEVRRVLKSGGRAVILNKFVDDGTEVSPWLKGANLLARPVITDITCRLGPIVQASGMDKICERPMGHGGFFKWAMLQKGEDKQIPCYVEPLRAEPVASGGLGQLTPAGNGN